MSGSFFKIFQGKWKSRNKVHSSELIVHYNHFKYIHVSSELNSHIPALNIHILPKDAGEIRLFSGLETDSDAVIKLTHTVVGAEVEDFKLHCELTNGNTITTDTRWRHGTFQDLQTFIKNVAINLESLTSDQHWVDSETAIAILHEFTNEISKNIINLSNIETKIFFVQIKRATSYARILSNGHKDAIVDLVDYYTASIDTFADFG